MDSDEDDSRSWISFKALKQAADMRTSYLQPTVTSPVNWPDIGNERKANPVTNVSLSFLNVHQKYRDGRPSDASVADIDQVTAETERLQRSIRSQEEHYKAKYAVMLGYLQEAGKRKRTEGVRSSLDARAVRRTERNDYWTAHISCQAEIEALKQTVAQQELVIEGLQNTVDSLHEKLAQQRRAVNRRISSLSTLQ